MIDVANCIADLWFRLGFLSAADMALAGVWITAAELYQLGDDAAKALARTASLFLTWDSSVGVVAGTPQYALPAAHVFTVTAWLAYGGAVLQLLRLSTVGQLFSLDGAWGQTNGPPLRLSLDAGGVGTATLYPNPTANSTLWQIIEVWPPTVALDASTLPVSPVLQDYFTDALLAGARGKESDAAMPDVAAHCMERMKLYDSVIEHLWGSGQ